jgi:hypothetical protein
LGGTGICWEAGLDLVGEMLLKMLGVVLDFGSWAGTIEDRLTDDFEKKEQAKRG